MRSLRERVGSAWDPQGTPAWEGREQGLALLRRLLNKGLRDKKELLIALAR